MNPVLATEYGCNRKSKERFLLQYKCLTPKIVYRPDVKNLIIDEKMFILELQETPFKELFSNYTRDFKHPKYRNRIELSNRTLIFCQRKIVEAKREGVEKKSDKKLDK